MLPDQHHHKLHNPLDQQPRYRHVPVNFVLPSHYCFRRRRGIVSISNLKVNGRFQLQRQLLQLYLQFVFVLYCFRRNILHRLHVHFRQALFLQPGNLFVIRSFLILWQPELLCYVFRILHSPDMQILRNFAFCNRPAGHYF